MKNVKECDVILLTTKGPSKIWKNNDGTLTVYKHEQFDKVGTAMHMYIVSPDNINDGDLVITNNPEYHDRIWEFKMMSCPMPYWGNPKECKKIVATDNPALKDRAFCTYPTISFEFMQLYAARYNAVTLVDAKVNIEKVNVEFIDGKIDERTGILYSNVNYDLTTNCIFVDFKPVKVTVTGKPKPNVYTKSDLLKYYEDYVEESILPTIELIVIREFIESLK